MLSSEYSVTISCDHQCDVPQVDLQLVSTTDQQWPPSRQRQWPLPTAQKTTQDHLRKDASASGLTLLLAYVALSVN